MLAHDEAKAAAVADITEHLATIGSMHWGPTRAKHKLISDAMWWRLVKDVKAGKPSQEILAKSVRAARKRAIGDHLPAAPSPSYIATGGQQAAANLNFLGHINRLFEDVELLRDFASKFDETGKRGIKNPVLFGQQAVLRMRVLETQIKGLQEAYAYQRLQDFFRIFEEEIRAVAPDVAERIMERVRKVNADFGVTINADV